MLGQGEVYIHIYICIYFWRTVAIFEGLVRFYLFSEMVGDSVWYWKRIIRLYDFQYFNQPWCGQFRNQQMGVE